MAVSLVPMVGVMALLLDGGMLLTEQRHARSVADTAALAAAYSLYTNYSVNHGLDPSGAAKTAAVNNAAGNGCANDGTTSVVTVNINVTANSPAKYLGGLNVGKTLPPGYVEVLVQNNQSKLFSAIWGHGTMSVTARAVARGIISPSDVAVLLLDPSMPTALDVVGNGGITATGGSIVVDSSDSQAGAIKGNGCVTATNINFTGSYTTKGNGTFNGTVQTGVVSMADPLASLPVPSQPPAPIGNTSTTKNPGTYTSDNPITGKGDVTLMPGIYYIQTGGFSMTGGSVTGSGVMIYNASTSDTVTLTGKGSLTLNPPTSGIYSGISIFQNRSSAATVKITGNGAMSVTGVVYCAKAEIDLAGNGDTLGSQIIANNMNMAGNGLVNVNHTPVRDTRIVE